MCWEAQSLTLIVNMFWAILSDCVFLCVVPSFWEWMLYCDILEVVLWKKIMGLMLLYVILHTCHGPWSASHQRASWNYQPSISPTLRLPFIYQDHVETHEFTFFLCITSLPRSNRASTSFGHRSAFNSVRSRSLWPLKIAELKREDVEFLFW